MIHHSNMNYMYTFFDQILLIKRLIPNKKKTAIRGPMYFDCYIFFTKVYAFTLV